MPYEEFARSLNIPNLMLTADTDCVMILEAPNLVKQLCPSITSNTDEDGLVPIPRENIDENGVIKPRFVLVPSEFLRPSFRLPNAPAKQEFLSHSARLAALAGMRCPFGARSKSPWNCSVLSPDRTAKLLVGAPLFWQSAHSARWANCTRSN